MQAHEGLGEKVENEKKPGPRDEFWSMSECERGGYLNHLYNTPELDRE